MALELYTAASVAKMRPTTGKEDKKMKNETRNDEAVSPVIATILMVAITVVLAGVLYVWAANLAESNTDGNLETYVFSGLDGNEEGAVVMTMDQGKDLGWASITVKAAVDGAASKTMVACSTTVADDCYEDANSADPETWNVGEAVTVKTADCNGICEIVVTILNNREGVTLDTTSITTE